MDKQASRFPDSARDVLSSPLHLIKQERGQVVSAVSRVGQLLANVEMEISAIVAKGADPGQQKIFKKKFDQVNLELNQIIQQNLELQHEFDRVSDTNALLQEQLEKLNKKYESMQMRMKDTFNHFAWAAQGR